MWEYVLSALGLMLIFEGVMPFLFPSRWRQTLANLARLQDGQMRFMGLTLMLSGLLLIYWMK